MNVLRLRVTDDMPMAARVLVWPRQQGGYFIYVRPGTPRGSVRCALRELKDTSAAHRELTVIAFAAKDAWRSPRERVMSFGAGLATTAISGGLATSLAVTGMAVPPNVQHHGRSLLPSWADLDPDANHAGKPAPAQHPNGSRPVTPSHLPQSHSGTSGRTVDLPSSASAARGHLAPGASKSDTPNSDTPKSAAPGQAKKVAPGQAKKAAAGQAKEAAAGQAKKAAPGQAKKAAPGQAKKAAKPSGHAGKG